MNRFHTALLSCTLAAAALLGPSQAHAALAMLVQCQATTSVTGKFMYVGTYNVYGKTIRLSFAQWCPSTVEVE